MSSATKISMFSVMLCFFAMGFVDLVGIASNYVKADFALSDATANILPSLVMNVITGRAAARRWLWNSCFEASGCS